MSCVTVVVSNMMANFRSAEPILFCWYYYRANGLQIWHNQTWRYNNIIYRLSGMSLTLIDTYFKFKASNKNYLKHKTFLKHYDNWIVSHGVRIEWGGRK